MLEIDLLFVPSIFGRLSGVDTSHTNLNLLNSKPGKAARLEWVRIPRSPTRAVLLFSRLKTLLYSVLYVFTYQSVMEGY